MVNCFVLRIGHRAKRDKRVTTHVALVARAFGASGFILEGNDESILKTVGKVVDKWGGERFLMESTKDGKAYVKQWRKKKGTVVHLTMYGINISKRLNKLKTQKGKVLVVVGAGKVDGWYYKNSDYNIAVGNQPHSEVAALGIFLDRINSGKELNKKFDDARIRIVEQENGKKVVTI